MILGIVDDQFIFDIELARTGHGHPEIIDSIFFGDQVTLDVGVEGGRFDLGVEVIRQESYESVKWS